MNVYTRCPILDTEDEGGPLVEQLSVLLGRDCRREEGFFMGLKSDPPKSAES